MTTVYFARVGDYAKIGFASNVQTRMKSLLGGSRLICPDDLDRTLTPELVLVIPFCRIRDERNLHMLFARHWAIGEWFRWTPEFEHQMRTMQFVTHATALKNRRQARKELGVSGAGVKEERWGKATPERLADAALERAS